MESRPESRNDAPDAQMTGVRGGDGVGVRNGVDGQAARAALDAAGAVSMRADRRARPPQWYVPSLAALVFVLYAAQALPVLARLAVLIVAVLGEGILLGAYQAATRTNPWRRKLNRRVLPLLLGAAVVAAALSSVVALSSPWGGHVWWCLGAGVIAVGMVLLISRLVDPVRGNVAIS